MTSEGRPTPHARPAAGRARRRAARLVAAVALVAAAGPPAAAQDVETATYTARDVRLDALLAEAAAFERRGEYGEAVDVYLRVERTLREREEADPHVRPVTEVGPGLDRGVGLHVAARVGALPPDVQAEYRLEVDPLARVALERAVASGQPERIEAVVSRYPLASSVDDALRALVGLAFERGELGRAIRAARRLEARLVAAGGGEPDEAGPDAPGRPERGEARQVAFQRLVAAALRGEPAEAERALAAYAERGGAPERPRGLAGREVAPAALVDLARRRERAAAAERPGGFDPGARVAARPLAGPELPEAIAERLEEPVVPSVPVLDRRGEAVVVADRKTVRSLPIAGAAGGWVYRPEAPAAEPARLDALPARPVVVGERVYATLHLNRPADVTLRPGGADPAVARRPDWRVVALERATGALVWDAARGAAFEAWSREAEWVSDPLVFEGSVYVVALTRGEAADPEAETGSDLSAYLLRLDATSGAVVFQTFLAARPGHDHLGLGAPPAPPAPSREGHVVCATGLGAVAAVEPSRGDVAWLARYPAAPGRSQATLVLDERRFRPGPPLTDGPGPVVVAPVDAAAVFAFDPASGARVWSAPRGRARYCRADPAGQVLLLGERLELVDRATGRLLFAGAALDAPVVAPPAVLGHEVVGTTPSGLVRIGLADGAVLARYRFEEPALEVGAPLALPDGRLAVASWKLLSLYAPFAARRRAIAALPAGPARDLALGRLLARRGEPAALDHLRRAARPGVPEETRLDARAAAFDLLEPFAWDARRRGDRQAFLRTAEVALGLAWDFPPGAPPDEPAPPRGAAARDLAKRSAPLLRAYGDARAAGPDRADWARAVHAFQALLKVPPTTLVPLEPAGVRVDARVYGRLRVREVVRRRGQDLYAEQDRLAETAYRIARTSGATGELAEVLERYPAAAGAADVRWQLVRSLLARDLRDQAAAQLERFVAGHPDDPRRAEALARLARIYEKLSRRGQARRALADLLAIAPAPRVRGGDDSPERAAPDFARPLLNRLEAGRDPAALFEEAQAAAVELPLRRVLRSRTELAAEGAELVAAGQPWAGPDDVVVLRRGDAFEVRRVPGGARVLVAPAPASRREGLRPWFAAGRLVVAHPDRLVGYGLEGAEAGREPWTVALELGDAPSGARLGPDAVHEVAAAGDVVVVLGGDDALTAVDAARGEVLWRRSLELEARAGLRVRGELAVAFSTAPAGAVAFDLASGAPRWTLGGDGGPGSRLSGPVWIGDGDALAFVEDGARIGLVDAASGRRQWTATARSAWFMEVLPGPAGELLVARLQGAAGPELRVYDAASGQELWRDDGRGRDGGRGPRPSIHHVEPGDGVLYTFRTVGGDLELWAQELASGRERWRWRASFAGTAPETLIETPSHLVVPRGGGLGGSASLTLLRRGTGRAEAQPVWVPGRRLRGVGVQPRAGALVVTTDRGLHGFARLDDEAVAAEAIALAARVEEARDVAAEARARLAARLEQAGRSGDALRLLEEGLLAEGVQTAEHDRLLAALAVAAETASDERRLELPVRTMPRPPRIDGELDDWWRPWSSAELRTPRHVQPLQLEPGEEPGRWHGREDLSARLYLGWDAHYLYFALDVQDTQLRPYDKDAERWVGDCLVIAIDPLDDGGQFVMGDDLLFSLALTIPKPADEDDDEAGEDDDEGQGRYFVHRKEDHSGAVYEAAIPWSLLADRGAPVQGGPAPGYAFGLELVLTDDDGERLRDAEGQRGALKALQLTPGVLLHTRKDRLWQGFIPDRFARITLR